MQRLVPLLDGLLDEDGVIDASSVEPTAIGIWRLARRVRGCLIVDSSCTVVEYGTTPIILAYLAAVVWFDVRVIKILHDDTLPERFRSFPWHRRLACMLLLRFVDWVVAPAEPLQVWARQHAAPDHVCRLSTLLPLPPSTPIPTASDERSGVISVGAMTPLYGFSDVAVAIEELRRQPEFGDLGLVLVSAGFALDEEYARRVVAGRSWISVRVDEAPARVLELMADALVFVRVTRNDSAGLSRVEALWCGTPVVATPCGLCEGMEMVEAGDLIGLRQAIERVLRRGWTEQSDRAARAYETLARESGEGFRRLVGEAVNRPERISGQALWITALNALTLLTAFGTGVLLARALGPELKGMLNVCGAVASGLVEALLLGTGGGILYVLSRDPSALGGLHGSLLAAICLVALGMAVVAAMVVNGVIPGLSGVPSGVLAASLLGVPAAMYQSMAGNMFVATGRAVSNYIIGFIGAIASLVAYLGLWATGSLGVATVVGFGLVSGWSAMVLSARILSRQAAIEWPDLGRLQVVATYGLWLYATNLANTVHFRADQIMIGQWLGPAEVGVYAVAVRFAELLLLVDVGVHMASFASIATGDLESCGSVIRRSLMMQLCLIGPAALLLMLCGGLVITRLYGAAFAGATGPLVALLPGLLAWSLSRPFSVFLNFRTGNAPLIAIIAWVCCGLNLVLNWCFLDGTSFGIVGPALASSMSYGGLFMAVGFLGWRRLRHGGCDSVRRQEGAA